MADNSKLIENSGLNGLITFYMEPKSGEMKKVSSGKGNQYWELVSFKENDVSYQKIESNYNALLTFAENLEKSNKPDHADKFWKLISFDPKKEIFTEEATTEKHELAYFSTILEKNANPDHKDKIWGLISYSK